MWKQLLEDLVCGNSCEPASCPPALQKGQGFGVASLNIATLNFSLLGFGYFTPSAP